MKTFIIVYNTRDKGTRDKFEDFIKKDFEDAYKIMWFLFDNTIIIKSENNPFDRIEEFRKEHGKDDCFKYIISEIEKTSLKGYCLTNFWNWLWDCE